MSVSILTKVDFDNGEVTASRHTAFRNPCSKTFRLPERCSEVVAHQFGLAQFCKSEDFRTWYGDVQFNWHLGCLDYETMIWVGVSDLDNRMPYRLDR